MDAQLAHIGINFLVGAGLGLVSGTLGIGGGLLAVPLLVLGYGMDQQIAQGTALVVMAPNMLIGFLRYRQRNPITFRMGALLAVGSVSVTYVASLAAAHVSSSLLRTLMSIFLLGLAIQMGWQSFPRRQPDVSRKGAPHAFLPLAGGIGGFFSGFFTIGGGVVVVPILTTFFAFSQTAAQGLILAMQTPTSLVALGTYAHMGFVNWNTAIPIAIGSILTISYGVALAHKLPEIQLRRFFGGLLLVSAIMMLLK